MVCSLHLTGSLKRENQQLFYKENTTLRNHKNPVRKHSSTHHLSDVNPLFMSLQYSARSTLFFIKLLPKTPTHCTNEHNSSRHCLQIVFILHGPLSSTKCSVSVCHPTPTPPLVATCCYYNKSASPLDLQPKRSNSLWTGTY